MTDETTAGLSRDIQEAFRRNTGGLSAACEQARDLVASFPVPDPEVPEHWAEFALLTGQLRVLLGYLAEAGVPSSAPGAFRSVVLADLSYLNAADTGLPGRTLAGWICRRWTVELGVEHPDRISAHERYAALCLAVGAGDEAVGLLRSLHRLCAKLSGPRSPAALSVAADLCGALSRTGDHQSALRLGQDLVPVCTEVLGGDSDTALRAVSGLAGALRGLGGLPAAFGAYREVHEKSVRTRGQDHLSTLRAADDLAIAAQDLENHELALTLNQDLLQRYKRLLGGNATSSFDEDKRIRRTRDRLSSSLRALGRDDEAEALYGPRPDF
ncbi:hypothetical protein DN069_19395 [Streptacidiphilus pinicola]|uniref:Tetratricopeptide repeat protein n=1 Tax=Streptacidiphilus pinicola TaxID=2219663 RepID=A0A2X0IH88_9ACTN|nr:tetratricopeptide repeat protein [Streptacidiphilus pinicola]RAG83927.1 hypothetical protein DN069_19395 [Streptacidiphilus pinicola]